jgi:hypothetical protein
MRLTGVISSAATKRRRRMRPCDTPKTANGPAKAAGPLLAPDLLVGERGFEPLYPCYFVNRRETLCDTAGPIL